MCLRQKGILLTDDFIGNTANDGLLIGLNSTSFNSIAGADISWRENSPLTLRQNALQRIILTDVNWGATANLNRVLFPYSGFAGGGVVGAPFSMLHAGISPPTMQRNWMNVGLTLGTNVNSDMMHIGLLEHNGGLTDAVVSWGCQAQGFTGGPDNLRFLFLTSTALGLPASAQEGLETARITPNGLMGIGDYSNTSGQGFGTPDYIDARLDIDGDLRIRTVTENDTLTRVLVINENDHNRVHWLDINDIAGQCDWNIVNSNQDLAMGYTSVAGACVPGNVGIGDLPPADSRLFVTDAFGDNNENAVSISASGSFNGQSGINVRLTNSGGNNGGAGVRSYVTGGKSLWAGRFTAVATNDLSQHFAAVDGFAQNNTGIGNYPIGVYGKAENTSNLGRAIGLYGEGYAPNGTGYSAYLIGTPVTTNPVLTLSDQSLKTNVQSIGNATGILNQLKPCTYDYAAENSLSSALNGVQSMGFIAQEVQEVLPVAVEQFVHPGKWDDNGNQIFDDVELLGVKYDLFIPILVAGFQEQQATIAAQQAQIEVLTALVNQCCTAGGASDKSLNYGQNQPQQDFDLRIEQAYLGQNTPNPFQNETSITYRIPAQAVVRVRVMDAKGQQVDMLVDGLMPKGEFKIIWNASHLPGGMYYYTLEADGIELVKKAVKL